jgi:hypothetical protein
LSIFRALASKAARSKEKASYLIHCARNGIVEFIQSSTTVIDYKLTVSKLGILRYFRNQKLIPVLSAALERPVPEPGESNPPPYTLISGRAFILRNSISSTFLWDSPT